MKEEGILQLRYERPAGNWNEALPIGNGRMGAMIFGQPLNERIQLNEDSMWYGGPSDRINPDAGKKFPEIRRLVQEGRIPEAEELMLCALSGVPQSQRPYQTAGDLEIRFTDLKGKTEHYCRVLDLEKGMAFVSFENDGKRMTKEYLASWPQQILAVRIRSSRKRGVSFSAILTRARFYEHAGKLTEDSIYLDGTLGEGGSSYILAAKAVCKGGETGVTGERLVVQNADEAVIYLAMETTFYQGGRYREKALERLEQAAGKGYEAIREEHWKDYESMFGRVSLRLTPDSLKTDWTAEELLQAARKEEEGTSAAQLRLAEIYFQFGRYLLISSSRPGSLPANLQGIWNKDFLPPWDSKYTININTQMNYWPAECCNLSECHEPLFDLLERMRVNGRKVAKEMYGCRGFMAHNNTDIWADCAPQGTYIPATYWVTGAAWLCTHIWTHYLYIEDREFLERMYPVLEDAVLFFHDYLILDNGELVTCPTVSPENTYIHSEGIKSCICKGAAMDDEILRDLFTEYLQASRILGIEGEVQDKTAQMLKQLPTIQIGKMGQIMEWEEDYEEAEPGHRHIAHLYALHPSNQITVDKTPELAKAAERTLERRLRYSDGMVIGWNSAWIALFYARLRKKEEAWEYIRKLLASCTLPNFLDYLRHNQEDVFQIEGNFGGTAAITELLLQSDENRTVLLPALPGGWKDGSCRGLKTVGGAWIEMEWKDEALVNCRFYSEKDLALRVLYGEEERTITVEAGKYADFYV